MSICHYMFCTAKCFVHVTLFKPHDNLMGGSHLHQVTQLEDETEPMCLITAPENNVFLTLRKGLTCKVFYLDLLEDLCKVPSRNVYWSIWTMMISWLQNMTQCWASFTKNCVLQYGGHCGWQWAGRAEVCMWKCAWTHVREPALTRMHRAMGKSQEGGHSDPPRLKKLGLRYVRLVW